MTHKLLLADDSVTIQRVVELTFSGEDVQVVTVGDGDQAIQRIPLERPDVVLADIGMPRRNGYEVSAFVKDRPDLSHIPVLLLAGAFEPVDESRAQEVRCDGVLVKPFEPQQVVARVRELLDRGAAEDDGPRSAVVERTDLAEPGAPSPTAGPWSVEAADEQPAPGVPDQPLEDYFDRLDAAFAQLEREPEIAAADTPDVSEEPEPVPTVASVLAVESAEAGARAVDQVAVAEMEPEPALAGSAETETAADAVDEVPQGRNVIADVFAALFAAEQGEALPVVPAGPAPSPLSPAAPDALVEEVTRRVAAGLGRDAARELVAGAVERHIRDEVASRVPALAERIVREEVGRVVAGLAVRLVREAAGHAVTQAAEEAVGAEAARAVSDVAERLVREEIARIRAAAEARA